MTRRRYGLRTSISNRMKIARDIADIGRHLLSRRAAKTLEWSSGLMTPKQGEDSTPFSRLFVFQVSSKCIAMEYSTICPTPLPPPHHPPPSVPVLLHYPFFSLCIPPPSLQSSIRHSVRYSVHLHRSLLPPSFISLLPLSLSIFE